MDKGRNFVENSHDGECVESAGQVDSGAPTNCGRPGDLKYPRSPTGVLESPALGYAARRWPRKRHGPAIEGSSDSDSVALDRWVATQDTHIGGRVCVGRAAAPPNDMLSRDPPPADGEDDDMGTQAYVRLHLEATIGLEGKKKFLLRCL